jgi:hypothetical protein
MMTKQEIFDRVWNHLNAQGRAAAKQTPLGQGACQYRAKLEDGTVLSCAVGCLIPDELYDEKLEGQTVEMLYRTLMQSPRVKAIWDVLGRENLGLLADLQSAHDNILKTVGLEFWRARMRDIASEFNLTVPA